MQTYGTGHVELYLHPPTVAAAAGERPTAFGPARWQATNSVEAITNVYHEVIELNHPALRPLLTRLDGTRTREQILAESGTIFAGPNGPALLHSALDEFVRLALLVG